MRHADVYSPKKMRKAVNLLEDNKMTKRTNIFTKLNLILISFFSTLIFIYVLKYDR